MVRVILANDPALARETLGRAIAVLRPGSEVLSVAPEQLEAALAEYSPHLVVCSRASELLERCATRWVILHPDGAADSVLGVHGVWRVIDDLPLGAVVELLDQAASDAGERRPPAPAVSAEGAARFRPPD